MGSGFISPLNPSSIIKSYDTFSSSDGGNGFALVTKIDKSIDGYISDPNWEVYAIFLDKNGVDISSPYLLYQSPIDWVDLTFNFCYF